MRIIAGELRGRRLLPPDGDQTRPVTDRVKQSVFDRLGERCEGAHVVDVFAGTGSFGLEALSRGALSCAFVERHGPTAARLKQNVDLLGVADRAKLMKADAYALASFAPAPDLVFCDPPFPHLLSEAERLRALLARLWAALAPGGLLMTRSDDRAAPPLPAEDEVWAYGSMRAHVLRKARDE